MISVITCSADELLYSEFSKNIAGTIGVPFEIICMDNKQQQYKSIAVAYNKGAVKAQYSHLCFIHEDVIFHSAGWGKLIIHHLSDASVGLIGLAGAQYKTKNLSTWLQPPVNGAEYNRYQFIQSYRYKNQPSEKRIANPLNELLANVVCIDGFFMACRKEVFQQVLFNEKLPGFHGYDFELSMRMGSRYRVCTALDIPAEHRSEGRVSTQWFVNALALHHTYKKQLPAFVKEAALTATEIEFAEELHIRLFRRLLVETVQNPFLLFKLIYSFTQLQSSNKGLFFFVSAFAKNMKYYFHQLFKQEKK